MSQNISVPPSLMQRQKEIEAMIKNFDDAKKLSERYTALKRKLEICREVKKSDMESLKDRRAISYFETCHAQIVSKIEQHDQNLKKLLDQMEATKKNLEEKLEFVNQRLSQAKERAENQHHHKTKEEVAIEREIQEMIPKYSELVPNADLSQAFPDYKKLLNLSEPIPQEPVYTAPANIPKPTPSATRAKRVAKKVDDRPTPPLEELYSEPKRDMNPLAMMSNKDIEKLSQAEIWNHLHPGKPNPFENQEDEEEHNEEEEEEETYSSQRFQQFTPKIIGNTKLQKRSAKS